MKYAMPPVSTANTTSATNMTLGATKLEPVAAIVFFTGLFGVGTMVLVTVKPDAISPVTSPL